MDLSDDGRFLYTLDIGTDAISTFRVRPDGSLELLGAIGGVPDGANGLAARREAPGTAAVGLSALLVPSRDLHASVRWSHAAASFDPSHSGGRRR